jgi:WD40 repeat protein/glycosyltransferase involved in cell wall biosynthesis
MTESHQPKDVAVYNERSLQKLAWAIDASVGNFKLFLARCNYINLRSRLAEELTQLVSVEIRSLKLKESENTLYARIQAELGSEQPATLMVFGLETVTDLEPLLISTNFVREEFQKNFHFPLILWLNDEILKKLARVAPDFESWATTIEFVIPPEELKNFVKQTADRWFANQFRLTLKASLELEAELESARRDLLNYQQFFDRQLEADLESLLGAVLFINDKKKESVEHYQKALEFWRESNDLDRQFKLLIEIAFCHYLQTSRYRALDQSDYQTTRHYLQQALEIFEQAQRPGLVANSFQKLGRILRGLQEWRQLQTLAENALQVHQTQNKQIEMSQDYGFLAEVALANQHWIKAKDFAQKALEVLLTVSSSPLLNNLGVVDEQLDQSEISYAHSQYEFILAQSQQQLSQLTEAIHNLEIAKKVGSPEYDTQLYLDILNHLQELYKEQKQYLEALEIKLYRQSIEQQYGLRAFVGAGQIEPQRQATLVLAQAENQETVAPEIIASGRLLDVKRLVKRIGSNDYKLVVIHGQSGVGKSSLINGGLLPELDNKAIGIRDILPVLIRVYPNWVEKLGQLLVEALQKKGIDLTTPLNSLEAILNLLRQSEQENLRIVLIFDQFEEFFFAYKDKKSRKIFYDFFSDALNILSLKLIISIREDYLFYLLEINRHKNSSFFSDNSLSKNIINNILGQDSLYYLGNFSKIEAKDIIRALTKRSQINLDEKLIETLVEDLASELEEVRPIELQVVGVQLEKRQITTLTEYQKLGSQAKAKLVEYFLAEVVADCGEENKETAELVLYLLTDENNTRPQKTQSELATSLVTESSKLELVLKIFVKSGLVLLMPAYPTDRYQLVHDYLVLFIRQQKGAELAELLKKYQQAEAKRSQLEEENQILASAYQEAECISAQAQQKAQRRIVIGTAVLFVSIAVAGAVIGVAWQQVKQAQKLSRLEQSASSVLRQFETGGGQLDALISAVQAVRELKDMVRQTRSFEDYPTYTPLIVLQQIVDNIQELNQLKGHDDGVFSVSFSPDGKSIATASQDGTARLWDSQGNLLKKFTVDKNKYGVLSVSFSPDGKFIATASEDGTARLWDLQGNRIEEFKAHEGEVRSVSFSPDGKFIATGGADNTARLWNLQGKQLVEFKGHKGGVLSVSFSPDGKSIATASEDGTARLWNLQGNLLKEFKGHEGGVLSVSFSPNGKSIATGAWDNTARLWDVQSKQLVEFKGHQEQIRSVSFSPDGKFIATGALDQTARLWNLQGKQLVEFKRHPKGVWSVSFSPDGKFIATASENGTVRLWDLQGNRIEEFKAHEGGVRSVSFSPDGKFIATGGWDHTARLWNLQGKKLVEFKGHEGGVLSVSFSPDGKFIATASRDGTARLWNLQGDLLKELKGHKGWVFGLSFSPDSKFIATASRDGTARLWNLQGNLLHEFKENPGWVLSISFNPHDGKSIAIGSSNGTIQLWNLQGKLLREFQGNREATSIAFSPDGRFIASGGPARTVQLWRIESLEETLVKSCNWLQDYLNQKNDFKDNETDRHTCDGILAPGK